MKTTLNMPELGDFSTQKYPELILMLRVAM